MIKKLHLQSLISKYHLGGLVEAVKWTIKDKHLSIGFTSPNKDMLGELNIKDIPLEDAEVAIFNTTQLSKLINITNGDLMIEFTKSGKVFNKMVIDDTQFTVNYSLADLMLISKPPKVNDFTFEIEVPLDKEIINALIKAKNALADINTLTLKSFEDFGGLPQIEVLFGDDQDYSNKVSYFIKNTITESKNIFSLSFDSDIIKEILTCNKDCNEGKLYLNLEGLLKLKFIEENIESEYYIVKKETN